MTRNVYEKCPIMENNEYIMRLVEEEDATELLRCYSCPTLSVKANSFNCNMGYDAYTVDKMREYIKGWRNSYFVEKSMVRWSVVDKRNCKAIGSVELFSRRRTDFFDRCGILRYDLEDNYETANLIEATLRLFIWNAFDWFDCQAIVTKVDLRALERIQALKKIGFYPSKERLYCGNDVYYDGFWILDNPK